jgi:hypothetical protein
MTFKDTLASDLSTFINPDEFGELHEIDGAFVVCVIDEDSRGQYTGSPSDGVYLISKTVYVEASKLVRRPIQDKVLRLDGEDFIVRKIVDESGMLTLGLEVCGSGVI